MKHQHQIFAYRGPWAKSRGAGVHAWKLYLSCPYPYKTHWICTNPARAAGKGWGLWPVLLPPLAELDPEPHVPCLSVTAIIFVILAVGCDTCRLFALGLCVTPLLISFVLMVLICDHSVHDISMVFDAKQQRINPVSYTFSDIDRSKWRRTVKGHLVMLSAQVEQK